MSGVVFVESVFIVSLTVKPLTLVDFFLFFSRSTYVYNKCRFNSLVCRQISVWNRFPVQLIQIGSVAKRSLSCLYLIAS